VVFVAPENGSRAVAAGVSGGIGRDLNVMFVETKQLRTGILEAKAGFEKRTVRCKWQGVDRQPGS